MTSCVVVVAEDVISIVLIKSVDHYNGSLGHRCLTLTVCGNYEHFIYELKSEVLDTANILRKKYIF